MNTTDSNKLSRAALGLLVYLLVLLPATAPAAEAAGVRLPDRVTLDSRPLVLNGMGIRRATIFRVKVYVAGLYVGENTRVAAEVLRPDRPKYFVAVMRRNVARDDSAPVFRKGIERSAGAEAAAIRTEIAAFEAWIPSMREGQQLTVSFTPDIGVIVRSTPKKEAFRGSVRFGTALFGMWIGPRATDSELRASLLIGQLSARR